jgi:hypothetical protein
MAYQRQYLQQAQAKTYSPGYVPTPGQADSYDYSKKITTEFGRVFTGWKGHPGARELGNYYGYAARDGKNKAWDYNEYWAAGNDLYGRNVSYALKAPTVSGAQQSALRRGEMAGGDLRLSQSLGKRRLRIEPTELGQMPGKDLPPPGADSYDPFSASEAEGLAGLRRKRGGQIDLSINASNASTGINTL